MLKATKNELITKTQQQEWTACAWDFQIIGLFSSKHKLDMHTRCENAGKCVYLQSETG